MPPTSAASRAAAARQQGSSSVSSSGERYELSANWSAIVVTACAAPWAALLFLNPVSLFFIFFWSIVGIFVSFGPKLLHFLLLELAIVKGRGTDFYERNHARRVRGAFPSFELSLGFIESFSAELSARLGAPDAVSSVALKEVAVARKKYAENPEDPLSYDEMGNRVMRLPFQLMVRFKDHAASCVKLSAHSVLRFVALNIVARLYTKTLKED
jgi:hypothetical protein